jgi:NAD(P)H dehydrogenase (quinone)
MTKIAIVYYSSTGNTYQLAMAAAEGARAIGAEVWVRKAQELAPRRCY